MCSALASPPACVCLAGVCIIEPSLGMRVKTIVLDGATYRAVGIARCQLKPPPGPGGGYREFRDDSYLALSVRVNRALANLGKR